jgi:hypothetical protein
MHDVVSSQLDWLHANATVVAPRSDSVWFKSSSVVTRSDPTPALVRVVRGGAVFWLSMRTRTDFSAGFDDALSVGWFNRVFLHRWDDAGNTLLVA